MIVNQINCLFLLGLMGERYSAGLYPLRERIRRIPGVDYTVVASYSGYHAFVEAINGFSDPTVIVGHSFGANAALEISRRVKAGKIPIILNMDASQFWSVRTFFTRREIVPDHMARCLHFYQRIPIIRGVIHERADGSSREIQNIEVPGPHTVVDDRAIVHELCVKEISDLVERLNPPIAA